MDENLKQILSFRDCSHLTITNLNLLILFREIIAVYSDNHTKPINAICGQNAKIPTVKAGGTYTYHCVLKR
jgi:hypothetical protein